jgi:hypothetical protein
MTTHFHSYEANERHEAAMLICAPTGQNNAARALVGRAIRKALGVKRWNEGIHFVDYLPAGYGYPDADARFMVNVTDAEMTRLMTTLTAMAEAEGWDRPPCDAYHD